MSSVQQPAQNVLFVNSAVISLESYTNPETIAIEYDDNTSTTTDMIQRFPSTNRNNINRLGFAFHYSGDDSASVLFLNREPFFTDSDLEESVETFSPNLQFMLDLLMGIKHVDFLACDTLKNDKWKRYYQLLHQKTGVVIGASDNNTGSLKYGGDWIMESTNEEVGLIYFTTDIMNWASLLLIPTTVNTYYHTFYTMDVVTKPQIMTRTIWDNNGTLQDTQDISFGGTYITTVLSLMNDGGTNPYTIGIVDSSLNRICMDLANVSLYTKPLTLTQQTTLITYVNANQKEPHTYMTQKYAVTVSGGVFVVTNSESAVMTYPISLSGGSLYLFDQSNSTNSGNPFKLSTTSFSLTEITAGVTTNGTPGSLNAYTIISPSSTLSVYGVMVTTTYYVKVASNIISKQVFALSTSLNGTYYNQPYISFSDGTTYTFYVSDTSVTGFNLVFGNNEIPNSSLYTVSGIPGQGGSYVRLTVSAGYSGATIQYFEQTRTGMGNVQITAKTVNTFTTASYSAPADTGTAKLITCSRDGKYVYLVSHSGTLATVYRSYNFGKTYSYMTFNTVTTNTVTKIITYDGKHIIICNTKEIYFSTDFGLSFSNVSLIQYNFNSVKSVIATPNLSHICLVTGVYANISTDKGKTWIQPTIWGGSTFPGAADSNPDIAISESGQYIYFSLNGVGIYINTQAGSNDYGQTVTRNSITNPPNTTDDIYGRKVFMSGNGQVGYAFGAGGVANKFGLFTSNYGQQWTILNQPSSSNLTTFENDNVRLSYDGRYQLYKDNNSPTKWYFSDNSGASFSYDVSYGSANETCIADESLFIYGSSNNTSIYNRYLSSSTYVVTVANNKFYIREESQTTVLVNPRLNFASGKNYVFDQSDSSNTGNTLVFGTFPDSSANMITYQTVIGTPGQPGAFTAFTASGELLYYFSFQQKQVGYQPGFTYVVNVVQNLLGQNKFAMELPGSGIFVNQPMLEFTTGNVYTFDVSNVTGYELVFGTTVDMSLSIFSTVKIGNIIKLDLSEYTGSTLYYFERNTPRMGYVSPTPTTVSTFTDFSGTFVNKKLTRSRNGQYVYVYGINSSTTHIIKRSNDYGATFGETTLYLPASTPFLIDTIKTDYTGQYIMVRLTGGISALTLSVDQGLYLSSDYGVTFRGSTTITNDDISNNSTNTKPKNYNKSWQRLTSTPNGQYLCGFNSTVIFTSNDYGTTWVERAGSGAFDVCISDDGKYIMFAYNSNFCSFVSNDYGATFQTKLVLGNEGNPTFGRAIYMSGNGKSAYITGAGGYTNNNPIFTNDYGNTWTRTSHPFYRLTISQSDYVRYSYSGQYQYYIDNTYSKLFYLSDGGSTFTLSTLSRPSDICVDDNSNIIALPVTNTNRILKVDVSATNFYTVKVSSASSTYTFTPKYSFYDSVAQPFVTFEPSKTYVFDQADSSNIGNTLVLGTAKDLSSSIFATIIVVGTAGQPGAYTSYTTAPSQIVYYFSYQNAGFGGGVTSISATNIWDFRLNQTGQNRFIDSIGGIFADNSGGIITTSGITFTGLTTTNNREVKYVNLGSLTTGGEFTFDMYVDIDFTQSTHTTWSRLFEFANSTPSKNIFLARYASGLQFSVRSSAGVDGVEYNLTTPTITTSITHIVGSVQQVGTGVVMSLYVNGTKYQVTTPNTTVPHITARTYNYIGKSAWSIDPYLVGNVKLFRLWKGGISEVDAATLYSSFTTLTYTTTISGGLVYLDGIANPVVSFQAGSRYVFDQSAASNANNQIVFSLLSIGNPMMTDGVTVVGTPGNTGAYTRLDVSSGFTGTLYYFSYNNIQTFSSITSVGKFYFNADSTANYTLDGSNVTRWKNKITGGLDASANRVDATGYPTIVTNIPGSGTLPFMKLAGTADQIGFNYNGGGISGNEPNQQTFFMFGYMYGINSNSFSLGMFFAKPGPYVLGTLHIGWDNYNNPGRIGVINYTGNTFSTNSINNYVTGSFTPGYYMMSITVDCSGVSTKGTVNIQAYSTLNTIDDGSVNKELGAQNRTTDLHDWNIGYWAKDSGIRRSLNSAIGEVMYFNRILSKNERYILEGKIAWKYGQASILPATHPFKTVAPS